MSDLLFSQSSRRPNNSQRYDDDDDDADADDSSDAVIEKDVAHRCNCRGDFRWRCGFDPPGWGHRLCTAATEAGLFPQIRWVILYGDRCRGASASDGDAVQPTTRRGTVGSRVSDPDHERRYFNV